MTFNRKIFSNPNPHPREIEFNPKPKQHEPIILEIGNNISRTIFYRNLKKCGRGERLEGWDEWGYFNICWLLITRKQQERMDATMQCDYHDNLIKPGWAGGFKEEEKVPQQYLSTRWRGCGGRLGFVFI